MAANTPLMFNPSFRSPCGTETFSPSLRRSYETHELGVRQMLTKRDLLRTAAAIAAGAAIARPSLLMAQSYPDIIEAKDIAEEGFIYGLPLVMNYAVMQSSPWTRTPGSSRRRSTRSTTCTTSRPTRTRRSSRRTATRLTRSVAGSARRADGDLGAGGGEGALLLGAADRRQHLQLWLHRQPRHGQRSGRLSRRRPRLERREARGHQAGLLLDHAVRVRQLSDPALQRRRHAERGKGAGRLQGAAAVGLPQAARAARRAEDRLPAGHHAGHQRQLLRLSRCRPPVRAAVTAEDKDIRAKLARIGIGPGQDVRLQGPPARTQAGNRALA